MTPITPPDGAHSDAAASASLWADPLDLWCEQCGVNHVYGGGLCSLCQADEDFYNCTYCGGTSCTGECDDDEDVS